MFPARPLRAVLAAALLAFVAVPPAHADETERQKLVVELFQIMKLDSVLDQTADAVAASIIQVLKSKNPNIDAETLAMVSQVSREEFASMTPELMRFTGEIYVRYFSEADLEAIVAFYSSEAGQKTITLMPQIMRDTMTWILPRQQEMGQRLVDKLKERLAKKGYTL